MPKPRREEEEKIAYEFPKYSEEHLAAFNKMLEEKYNNIRTVEDMNRWLMDEGAITKDGAVILTGCMEIKNKFGEYHTRCDTPSKYSILRHKLQQANKLQGKKEWAANKAAKEGSEALDALVEEMTLDKSDINNSNM